MDRLYRCYLPLNSPNGVRSVFVKIEAGNLMTVVNPMLGPRDQAHHPDECDVVSGGLNKI